MKLKNLTTTREVLSALCIKFLLFQDVAAAAAAAAKSLQSCLTLCDPLDGSPPDYPIPEILQARTLEWGAIAFSISKMLPPIKGCLPSDQQKEEPQLSSKRR